MTMQIVFFTNYPLVDHARWKQELIEDLSKSYDVFVIFGNKSLWSHYKGYMKAKRGSDFAKRYRYSKSGTSTRTLSFLRRAGIPFFRVSDVNNLEALRILEREKPDFGIAALDQILSNDVLRRVPAILNGHYGSLPEVKGWNATEWSILLKGSLSVCVHKVRSGLDQGEIVAESRISLDECKDLEHLRRSCQDATRRLYLKIFADPHLYMKHAQLNEGGSTYFPMNIHLRNLVSRILAEAETRS